jgi:hypothetical protein
MTKTKPSQTQRILSVLQKGKTLSVLQAEKMNIGNIRARMTDLRTSLQPKTPATLLHTN